MGVVLVFYIGAQTYELPKRMEVFFMPSFQKVEKNGFVHLLLTGILRNL